MKPRCRHGRELCSECIVIDDAAKRAFDVVRLLTVFNDYETRMHSPWVALRLMDGGSDSVLYDTRRDAIAHQLHEQLCAYFCFRGAPEGFASQRDAAVYLAYTRAAYDAGMRLPDPDERRGGPELIIPDMREHLFNQLGRLIGRKRG